MLKNVIPSIVAPPTITKEEDFISLRISKTTVVKPPQPNTFTGKFGSIVAGADGDVTDIVTKVVKTVRDSYTLS